MDNKDFKKEFCTTAKKYGFRTAFGCCYKESSECLFVLELQKSNYSNLYYLNLKTYIQGVFGIRHTIHKDYLKKDMGDIFNRQPPEYSSIFDLEVDTPNEKRIKMLNAFFDDFIVPYSEKNLSISGIRELVESKKILLTSAIEDELNRLYPKKE